MLIRVPDSESNDAERVLMARNPFQAPRWPDARVAAAWGEPPVTCPVDETWI